MTKIKNKNWALLFGASTCLMLSACADNATNTGVASNSDRLASHSERIDAALERAAYSAVAQGQSRQSLGYLERIYQRKSDDPVAATNYAAALRESGDLNRASLVLSAFAEDNESPFFVKSEYSSIQLALGNHNEAARFAGEATLMNPDDFRAYQNLGIALDMKGDHEGAENAFRKGLERWEGDPTPIMNNLALNLASQGFLEEAIEILNKAKALAPDRIEVERNLRIVTALQQSHGGYIPKPKAKPNS